MRQPSHRDADRAEPVTAWRCTSCGQPVDLVEAREHFNSCAGGDREPDRCEVCDTITDGADALCGRCEQVAR